MDGDQAFGAINVTLCEFCCRGRQGGSGSTDLGGSTRHALPQLLGTEHKAKLPSRSFLSSRPIRYETRKPRNEYNFQKGRRVGLVQPGFCVRLQGQWDSGSASSWGSWLALLGSWSWATWHVAKISVSLFPRASSSFLR